MPPIKRAKAPSICSFLCIRKGADCCVHCTRAHTSPDQPTAVSCARVFLALAVFFSYAQELSSISSICSWVYRYRSIWAACQADRPHSGHQLLCLRFFCAHAVFLRAQPKNRTHKKPRPINLRFVLSNISSQCRCILLMSVHTRPAN